MFFSHKNDINLDNINSKKHCNESTSINEETPPASTTKLGRLDDYHDEVMPFLVEYDQNVPYPIVSNILHNNGSNSSGIGSFSGPGNTHYGGSNVRNLCHRDRRIVSTDVEDLSTDEDITCPVINKGVADEMFDSMNSNPAPSIVHHDLPRPSALLNSIPPPPSEPPPSTPRDSYQEQLYPKGTLVGTGGLHGVRNMMDHEHILQQIPGVMDADPIPISYMMTQNNGRMPTMYSSSSNGPTPISVMGTTGRYRNQAKMPESATMSTLPHTHSQNGFGTGMIPRASGSVSGNSNVYENPYNSLNRQNGKLIKIGSPGGFPVSSNSHEIGYPVLTESGIPTNHLLYRQGSIRSPPNQSFNDPFFGIGKEDGGRCSWNCIRISLFSLAILLLLSLIAYFAAKSVWLEGRLNKRFAQDPVIIGLFDPKNLPVLITPNFPISITIKPMGVWSGRWTQQRSDYVHFNFTINTATNLGVFSRINSVPTIVRYSFFDRVSGYRWKHRILEPNRKRVKRSLDESYQQETAGIINYMEKGLWFVSVVNDQPREENIHFTLNTKVTSKQSCPDSCNKHGLCRENGHCDCFTGFKGRDCASVDAMEVCTGHGNYFQGRCLCNPEWKGIECQTIWYECEQSSCSGNGDCVSGDCVCKPGYGGRNCSNALCPRDCSSHGLCLQSGRCKCFQGWTGDDCSKAVNTGYNKKSVRCDNGGEIDGKGSCKCTNEFEGLHCEHRRCSPTCVRGRCNSAGICTCDKGYQGKRCDKPICDVRCYQHGECKDGQCHCNMGWNGKHCTINGCPGMCSNHGKCIKKQNSEYECDCFQTWKGDSCNISKEKECGDGLDNDNDGLIDCQDPDCCPTSVCEVLANEKQALAEESCPVIESLQLLILTTKLARPGSKFFEQIEFLTRRKYSSQNLNKRKISIVRGRVIQEDKTSFQGCRIHDRMRPSNGHTFTDKSGIFDLVVEGGNLVQLEIIRHPGSRFTGYHNVYVPVNEFVNIGDFILKDLILSSNDVHSINHGCMVGDRSVHDTSTLDGPRVLVDWSSEIMPVYNDDTLSMAIDDGILVNSIVLKETNLKLVHRSSRVKGFKSAIMIVLLGAHISPELKEIKLEIDVAGQMSSKTLEPDSYLTYTFYWDRQNAYSRKIYGLAKATVRAGYVYYNCSHTFWETRLTSVNGNDLAAKGLGNWNLNIRHVFGYNHGIIYMGDGSHIFLTETNWKISPIAGIINDQRTLNIKYNKKATEKRFFSLNSIVSDDKGRIIIADGKYIRILDRPLDTSSEWIMASPYYLKFIQDYKSFSKNLEISLAKHENNPALSNENKPADQKLYVSVAHMGSIWLIDPNNGEHRLVIGESCSEISCIRTRLLYPKGMAMSYNFSLYFADGRSIKMFSEKDMEITSVVGDASSLPEHSRLPGCFVGLPGSKTRLKWPTSVLYNPIDDSIYFVDNMEMVYRIGLNNLLVTVVAGNALNCPFASNSDDIMPANRHKFDEIRDIALSPFGDLYIAERRDVWVVKSDGYLYSVAGPNHHSIFGNQKHFISIASIAVTMFGELIVADNGVFQVFSVHYEMPLLNGGHYQVVSSDRRELYTFNSDGQHVKTDNNITGTKLYSLHFRLHSINGWLSKISSPSGKFQFNVHRDTQSRPTQLETPSGLKYNVTLDEHKRIISLAKPGCTWKFDYNSQDLLVSIQECQKVVPYKFSYYPNSGRLQSIIRPSGVTTNFEEHPVFYEHLKQKYKVSNRLMEVERFRLASAASTPHSSLFYSPPKSRFNVNNKTDFVFLHLKMIGPSNRIKLANGYEAKEMSLIDSQFKIKFPTHDILFYHVSDFSGVNFTRKIQINSAGPMRLYESQWLYQQSPAVSNPLRQKRSNRWSNDENEGNDDSRVIIYGPPRILKINGRKVIEIKYESNAREEFYSAFNGEKPNVLFRIIYNEDFQVTKITFTNRLADVVVAYSSNGRVNGINWPKPILQVEYDRLNRISRIFNAFLNEKLSYKYENDGPNSKVVEVSRGVNSNYRLIYDTNDNLMSVITPNNVRLEVSQLISLGYRRILLKSYGVISNFVYDFDTLFGNLFRVTYPSQQYRVNFFYSMDGQLSDVIYGSERIKWIRNSTNFLVNRIEKTDDSRGFKLQQNIEYDGPLLEKIYSIVTVPTPSADIIILNSKIILTYDSNIQLSKMILLLHDPSGSQPNIQTETTLAYNHLNQRIKVDEFIFQFDTEDKVLLPVENSYLTSKYNQNDLLQSRILSVSGHQASLEVSYNENSKNPLLISSFKIKKSNTNEELDIKFSYSIDSGMLITVHNGEYIQYRYFEDGRLRSVRTNSDVAVEFIYDERTGLLKSAGLVTYIFNDDGFLTQRRSGQVVENFIYNAFGLLKEYSKQVGQNKSIHVEYFYDNKNRLILQRGLANPRAIYQYFYCDLGHPNRLTHMHDSRMKQLSTYYYDSRSGHLFSIMVDKTLFYVLSDFIGSPRIILSRNFDLVWERDYDVFGEFRSLRKSDFYVPIGFGGSISDPYSLMVFWNGRMYDPVGKTFAGFHWQSLFTQLINVRLNPLALNTYQFQYSPSTFDGLLKSDFSNILQADFWMSKTGFDVDYLVSEKILSLYKNFVSLPPELAIKYVFDPFKMDSVHSFTAQNSAKSFRTLHSLQISDLVPQEVLPYCFIQVPSIATEVFSVHPNVTISIAEKGLLTMDTETDYLDSPFKHVIYALFRNSTLLDIYSSRGSVVLIFLIKNSCDMLRSDLRQLGLSDKSKVTFGQNINISVVRRSGDRVTEVVFSQRQFVTSVRYCSTLTDQTSSVRRFIKTEAERVFWVNKRQQLHHREPISDQVITDNAIELRKGGLLRNVVFEQWHNVSEFPLLFDDISLYKLRRPTAP